MSGTINLAGVGEIKLKRKSNLKNIRIRINHDGEAEVSAPNYVPMFVINRFVNSKKDWIKKHRQVKKPILDGMAIGRDHVVKVLQNKKVSIKTVGHELIVGLPSQNLILNPEVQSQIEAKAIESLRKEAKQRFPAIVKKWSDNGVGDYKKVTIKLIRTRWGSYSSNGNISLSLFMAQLPNELIDYIIVHELAHSVHMNHSTSFWTHVEKYVPDYKAKRKQLKDYNMSVTVR